MIGRMLITRRRLAALSLLPLVPALPVQTVAGAESVPAHVADLLRTQGLVLMLRHAQTDPGVGDPPNFALGDCRTQRNLSTAGRAQAARLGERWRALGLKPHIVRSSAWCRCVDTAEIAFAGNVERWPALNSFFGARATEPAQTAELRRALSRAWPGHVEAWVTHMVNVAALTGENVAMGEALVLARGTSAPRLLMRLPAP